MRWISAWNAKRCGTHADGSRASAWPSASAQAASSAALANARASARCSKPSWYRRGGSNSAASESVQATAASQSALVPAAKTSAARPPLPPRRSHGGTVQSGHTQSADSQPRNVSHASRGSSRSGGALIGQRCNKFTGLARHFHRRDRLLIAAFASAPPALQVAEVAPGEGEAQRHRAAGDRGGGRHAPAPDAALELRRVVGHGLLEAPAVEARRLRGVGPVLEQRGGAPGGGEREQLGAHRARARVALLRALLQGAQDDALERRIDLVADLVRGRRAFAHVLLGQT